MRSCRRQRVHNYALTAARVDDLVEQWSQYGDPPTTADAIADGDPARHALTWWDWWNPGMISLGLLSTSARYGVALYTENIPPMEAGPHTAAPLSTLAYLPSHTIIR